MLNTTQLVLFSIFSLSAKFFIYSLYAKRLNRWFEEVHNSYRISAVRVGLSLVFTLLNYFILNSIKTIYCFNIIDFGLVVIFLILFFSVISWSIIVWLFYHTDAFGAKDAIVGVILPSFSTVIIGCLDLVIVVGKVNFC